MYLKNLIEMRKKKSWSQEKLAREANISYNTLIKIERNGIENPKIETVIKLAEALRVSVDELVGRNVSEIYFEKYLDARNIKWDYEAFEGKKLDYLLHLETGDVICEVKEIDDKEDIKRAHRFQSRVKNELTKLNLAFSVSCRCSETCGEEDLGRFCGFIKRYRGLISKEMRVGDRVTLGNDFIVGKGKLIVIENQGKDGTRYFTLETKSQKYPLKRRSGQYGLHEKFLLTSNGDSTVQETMEVSSFKDPLLEIERMDVDGNFVLQPVRVFAIDKVAQIRGAIDRARRQFRPHKNKDLPFVLVLFSKGVFDIDEQDVLQAMFGKLTMSVYVSSDPNFKPAPGPTYYGKQAMMKGKNTSFSAVSLLIKRGENSYGLFTLHNPWAKRKLRSDVFNDPMDRQIHIDSRSQRPKEYRRL